ncbi:MAG TPA: DUF4255 domain-containing protein [Chthoniobacterales bacterium]|nr:DUF4255 domain-containing protein [Chthoniobacterales bacterium]
MSSPLAIAAVTAVLTNLLDNGVVDNSLGPVKVSAKPPDRVTPPGSTDVNQLNLFLYHVAPNPGWRNAALPSRDADGAHVSNPPLALDLFYLLTAYGEKDFQAEVLLGYGMQIFHETPVLTRDMIRAALGSSGGPPVDASFSSNLQQFVAADLAEQVEQIKIIPQSMGTEEMSKLWTALQTAYRPTAAYQISVVLIESKRPVKPTLPVRERIVKVVALQRPMIDSIESNAGADMPIVANDNVIIKGQQLRGEITNVVINGAVVTPAAADMTDDQIKVTLLAALRAGLQSVQVVHQIDLGNPPVAHRGVESNVSAFVLHPTLVSPAFPATATFTVSGPKDFILTFNPKVSRSQRVTLLLSEKSASPVSAFSIGAPPENGIAAGLTETDSIKFSLDGVPSGDYFVRLQVDGAESALTMSGGQFDGPLLTVTIS